MKLFIRRGNFENASKICHSMSNFPWKNLKHKQHFSSDEKINKFLKSLWFKNEDKIYSIVNSTEFYPMNNLKEIS